MVDKARIAGGVVNMLEVNLGVKAGEKLLVMSDVPTDEEWLESESDRLMHFLERSVLGKAVGEIASERISEVRTEFYPFPSTGKSGTEPLPEVAQRMKRADLIVAITSHSLSHTDAREGATRAGARVASMPGFLEEMFYPEGPMTVDYDAVAVEATRLADLMTDVEKVGVRSSGGTDIEFSLKGRRARPDTGLYRMRGEWGNLPAGEAYVAPLEGSAEGRIVVEVGWYPGLREEMSIVLRRGIVDEIEGGGDVGDRFRSLLRVDERDEPYLSRRNLAELGVGVNPRARRTDNILEAEKIRGTVHLAVGDNAHFGGRVKADTHNDFVIPKPDLTLDGVKLMERGKLFVT
ncbi:MAG: aminopeptidase [Candidatus Geothermarchaeales archaeon]